MSDLYKADFYRWTRQQVDLLQRNQFHAVDLQNLIEEVKDLGREKLKTLEHHLSEILSLMLKRQLRNIKKDTQTMSHWYRSWFMVIDYSLEKQRNTVNNLLTKNSSLNDQLEESLLECYPIACRNTAQELEIAEDAFPDTNPWSVDKILADESAAK